jgi:hypothetical protein
MSELFDDIATAFNQARFQLANDFDKMRADNMKFYRTHAQSWVDAVAKQYGYDGVGALPTYTVALYASEADVLLDFVQGVGAATFIDPLRLGEGIKKGTVGGYVEDGLRVIGIVGGAVKLLKFAKFAMAAGEVRGGWMSCTSSAGAKALIQAAIKSTPTVEEVARFTSNISVRLPSYPGAFIADIVPNLEKVGATVEKSTISGVKDVMKLVNQNKGPVLFSVEWPAIGNIPGGGHTMMAYRPFFGSGIRLADQFGNLHTLESVNTGTSQAFRVIAGVGTKATKLLNWPGVTRTIKAGDVIGQISRVYSDAFVLRDAVLLDVAANLPLAQRIGVPIYTALDDQFNLKLGYLASQLPTAPPKLMATGDYVNKAIATNPNGTPAQRGSSGSAPKRSRFGTTAPQGPGPTSALSANAQTLLGLLGGPGSKIDGKSLRQKAMDANIDPMQYHPALDELEGSGAVTVERAPVDNLTIISVTQN